MQQVTSPPTVLWPMTFRPRVAASTSRCKPLTLKALASTDCSVSKKRMLPLSIMMSFSIVFAISSMMWVDTMIILGCFLKLYVSMS